MEDRFEETFSIEAATDEVWERLVAGEQPDGRWFLPGFEATGVELEREPPLLIRVRKDGPPCEGTEIVITLESVATGTKVTVVQSGFGEGFAQALEWLEIGWSHIVADLALYLERGISARRHLRPWATLGCDVRATKTGLEVVDVGTTGFAARAGLAKGDLLVGVAGAPIVTPRELATLMRVLGPGDKVEVSFVRGSDQRTATDIL